MTDFVTIKGNLGADPKYSAKTGVPVARFNVGSTERRFNRATKEWEDGHTNWHRIVVFRDQARNVAVSLGKGAGVVIHGRIRNRRVNQGTEADPKWAYFSEIEADHVGVDLARGYVNFFRGVAAEPPTADGEAVSGPAPAGDGDRAPEAGPGAERSTGEGASGSDWGSGFGSPGRTTDGAETEEQAEGAGEDEDGLGLHQAA